MMTDRTRRPFLGMLSSSADVTPRWIETPNHQAKHGERQHYTTSPRRYRQLHNRSFRFKETEQFFTPE